MTIEYNPNMPPSGYGELTEYLLRELEEVSKTVANLQEQITTLEEQLKNQGGA